MYSKVLYHGTRNKERLLKEGFREDMQLSGIGVMAFGRGFYVTEKQGHAKKFGSVVKVRVTMQNPYVNHDFKRRFKNYIKARKFDYITSILRSEGYDGIIIDGDRICVFDAENIKVI